MRVDIKSCHVALQQLQAPAACSKYDYSSFNCFNRIKNFILGQIYDCDLGSNKKFWAWKFSVFYGRVAFCLKIGWSLFFEFYHKNPEIWRRFFWANRIFRKIFTGSLSGSEPEIHRFIKSIEDIGVWSFRYLLVVHFEKWVCPIDDAIV